MREMEGKILEKDTPCKPLPKESEVRQSRL